MRYKVLLGSLLCVALSACGKSEYQTTAGASGQFADLKGRWLLVNYWAEWCRPCLEELPELNRFQRRFEKDAVVFAVNFDGLQGEQLKEQVARLGIEVAVLNEDPSTRLGFKRPEALPSTYVFSPDGKLQQVLQGEQTVETLAAAIKKPIAQPAP